MIASSFLMERKAWLCPQKRHYVKYLWFLHTCCGSYVLTCNLEHNSYLWHYIYIHLNFKGLKTYEKEHGNQFLYLKKLLEFQRTKNPMKKNVEIDLFIWRSLMIYAQTVKLTTNIRIKSLNGGQMSHIRCQTPDPCTRAKMTTNLTKTK